MWTEKYMELKNLSSFNSLLTLCASLTFRIKKALGEHLVQIFSTDEKLEDGQ
jgi:hypothetical protein